MLAFFAALTLVACGGPTATGADAGLEEPGGADGAADAGSSDAGLADAGAGDAGVVDAGPPDAGSTGPGVGLSSRYPGDDGIGADPAVLFHSGFEDGMAGWSGYTQDPTLMQVEQDPALAHAGARYLRASVSRTQLEADPYISSHAQYRFDRRVPVAFWRFYARFVGDSAVPHHWVRVGAGTPGYDSDGLAGVVPPGDQGFWFDLDAKTDGRFAFYVYWHEMRSWECNDGTTDPGCAGYNGPSQTPYWGNNFDPAGQAPFPRDAWFCLEIRAKANTPGQHDGELTLWMNDVLVGEYREGSPRGRWLRDSFFTHGPYYADEQAFEGFDFRTSEDVLLKKVTLDAYYEKGTLDRMAADGVPVPEDQVTLYDDVVVATERIGCRVAP